MKKTIVFFAFQLFVWTQLPAIPVIIQVKTHVTHPKPAYILQWNFINGEFISESSANRIENTSGSFTFDWNPGKYQLYFTTPFTELKSYQLYVQPSSDTVRVDVTLRPIVLPAKITKVGLIGDFNKENNDLAVALTYVPDQNQWVLPSHISIPEMTNFKFLINGKKIIHNPYQLSYREEATMDYIHDWGYNPKYPAQKVNKVITFKPSLFPHSTKENSVVVSGTNDELEGMIAGLSSLEKQAAGVKWDSIGWKFRHNVPLPPIEQTLQIANTYCDSFLAYKARFSPELQQGLLDYEFECYRLMRNFFESAYKGKGVDRERLAAVEGFIQRSCNLLKNIDPTSYSLDYGSLAHQLVSMDLYLQSQGVTGKFVPSKYFSNKILSWCEQEDATSDFKSALLYKQALMLPLGKIEERLKLLDKIEAKCKNSNYYIINEKSFRSLKGLTVFQRGAPTPPFSLQTLEGVQLTSDELKGKTVLLYFYQLSDFEKSDNTGFPMHKVEQNLLTKIQEVHTKYPKDSLQVYGILCNYTKGKSEALLKKYGITFPNLLGDNGRAADFGSITVPFILLLDKTGKIYATDLAQSNVEAKINKCLNQ